MSSDLQRSEDEQNLSAILQRLTPQRAVEVALEAVKKANEERDLVKHEANESIEKAKTFDHITQTNKWLTIAEAAKNLAFKNVGPNILEQILRDQNILMSPWRVYNQPYSKYVVAGYFKIVQVPFRYPNSGEPGVHFKPVVSEKGLDFLRRLLEALGYEYTES